MGAALILGADATAMLLLVCSSGVRYRRHMDHLRPRTLISIAIALLVVALASPGSAVGAAVPLPAEEPGLPLVALETVEGVVVQRLDGAGRAVVDPSGLGPVWSPDGEALAWSSPEGGWHVGIAAVVDGVLGPPTVFAVPAVEGPLTWSPDASAIAFAALRQDGGSIGSSIAVVEVVTGEVSEVSAPPDATFDTRPTWSPTGDRIAFLRRSEGLSPAVVTTGLDGSEAVLTERLPALADIAWTPTGDRLVVAWQDAVELLEPGSGVRTLVNESGSEGKAPKDVEVASDGRTVAIADGGVVLADLESGDVEALTVVEVPLVRVAWTPLADAVVASGYTDDSGCHCQLWETWILRLDGTAVRLEPHQDGRFDEDDGYDRPAAAVRPPDLRRVARVSGPSRVETAVAGSKAVFSSAEVVVIARADAYPDALAGGPLTRSNGPLLLTPTDALHPAVAEEVDRLQPARAVLVGDESAIGEGVAQALRERGIDVQRVGGSNRFATAAAAAATVLSDSGADRAYIVEGGNADPTRGWPDAVAVSGLATATGRPILLIERDRLPTETRAALEDARIGAVTVVGGTAAVSEDVEAELAAMGLQIDRLEGASRLGTSAAVAAASVDAGVGTTSAWIATAADWPDALAAGPAAAAADAVLLLAPGDRWRKEDPTRTWLADAGVTAATLVGGPDVLSPQVAAQAAASLTAQQ